MALFDDILGKVGGHPELANMATKLGISPEMAERAVAALGEAHQAPGDTVPGCSARSSSRSAVRARWASSPRCSTRTETAIRSTTSPASPPSCSAGDRPHAFLPVRPFR